ncbi:hypothetical protein ACE418_03005 [Megasphaera sp. WILCCON 0056]|uniref:hypothetical protein n=1 Tax=Megasphaera sp. WILCCON 0056 TaxID=3345340 RepID=UPI003A8091A4
MNKVEKIKLEATLAAILGINSPDQKFSITIEGFTYKDITMRTHLADVMLIVAKSAVNNEPFKVTTEHIIDLDPEYPEEDPDDMDDEDDDEIIENPGQHLVNLFLRTFGEKE